MIITRFHNMTQLRITVEFLTPTFLGGADQNAELRAAPFKNLLRQWWRVAVGSQYNDPKNVLAAEGELFGSVLDDQNEAQASKVRLTLASGKNFELAKDSLEFGVTLHPEVGHGPNGMNISNALYLGYGPITFNHGNTTFRQYIAPGSAAELTLVCPKAHEATLRDILTYIDAFGTIGSRCRNGWGSLALSGDDFNRRNLAAFTADDITRVFDKGKQYPTAPGKDGKGFLCWEGGPFQGWNAAMRTLAETYLNTRVATNIKPQGLSKRHILGYPVTHHNLQEWGGGAGRMPSQLRLMVKRNTKNELVARILHLPHKLPQRWDASLGTELAIWQDIHKRLDANTTFHRCGGAQ